MNEKRISRMKILCSSIEEGPKAGKSYVVQGNWEKVAEERRREREKLRELSCCIVNICDMCNISWIRTRFSLSFLSFYARFSFSLILSPHTVRSPTNSTNNNKVTDACLENLLIRCYYNFCSFSPFPPFHHDGDIVLSCRAILTARSSLLSGLSRPFQHMLNACQGLGLCAVLWIYHFYHFQLRFQVSFHHPSAEAAES